MRFWFVVALFIALGICSSIFAQYSEIDHDERQVLIGTTGINDTVSTSATAILPFDTGKAHGWLGLHYQQSTVDGELISDIRNMHIEGGVDVGIENLSVNAFAEQNSDRERGIARQRQFGGFIRYELTVRQRGVAVGFGNFIENEAVRAELGLKEADSNVSRWLIYASTEVFGLELLVRGTPQVDFSDQQITLEPSYTFALESLGEDVSLVASAVVEVESDPIVEGKHVSTSYALQLAAKF